MGGTERLLFLGAPQSPECLLQSCLTLCNPTYYSSPGSSVHGILQARILEWVAMPFSRGLPDPWIKPTSLSLLRWQASSLALAPPGPCWYQKLDSLSSIPLTILLLKKKKNPLIFSCYSLNFFSIIFESFSFSDLVAF